MLVAPLDLAAAHEAVDAAEADAIVARVTELDAAIAGAASTRTKAEALFDLGAAVGRAIALVNRDLAAHTGNPGIVSAVLLARLKMRGAELAFSSPLGRYKSYLAPFERYLALAPGGPRRADALYRVLSGRFYDGFAYDPFDPLEGDALDLSAEIEMAEAFLAADPTHPGREEARLILAVDYARAFRAARNAETAAVYGARARAALAAFREAYPESLRAAAAATLLKGLSAAD